MILISSICITVKLMNVNILKIKIKGLSTSVERQF